MQVVGLFLASALIFPIICQVYLCPRFDMRVADYMDSLPLENDQILLNNRDSLMAILTDLL